MKYFIKAFISIILIIACIFVPKKIYFSVNEDEMTNEMYRRREQYFHGTLEMWQIDCFEGGTGSRTNWLKNNTLNFEKKHNGVYVNVNSVSLEVANKLITSGQKKPDIISFGEGIILSANDLCLLDFNAENLIPCVKNVTCEFAVPWCMGAYFMFGDNDVSLWGNDGKTVTSKKAVKNIYSVGIGIQKNYSSKSALESYCSNDFSSKLALLENTPSDIFFAYNYSEKVNRFMGTQRDFFRFRNAEQKNAQRDKTVTLIPTYNDLFQFVSVFDSGDEKRNTMACSFVNYLLECDVQSQIAQTGLFPTVLNAQPYYEIPELQNSWEQIIASDIICQSHIF